MARFRLRDGRAITHPDGADDEVQLLARLRCGDESAFLALVKQHHEPMLRLARTFVQSQAVAEEIVQDTWVAVLGGIEKFEGRSSLRTWLLAILVNRARSTGAREARSVPSADPTPAVDATRFNAAGGWSVPPEPWVENVEDRIGADALAHVIRDALAQMPARQRAVLMLRDVDQLHSDEVCEVLAISPANERVLLHRGRSRLRQALEDTIGGC